LALAIALVLGALFGSPSMGTAAVAVTHNYVGFSVAYGAESPTACHTEPFKFPDVGGVCFAFDWGSASTVQVTIRDASGKPVGGKFSVQDNQAIQDVAGGQFCGSFTASLPNPYQDRSGVLWLEFDAPYRGSLKTGVVRPPCFAQGGHLATRGSATAIFS
jgi:hypothetical protein